MTATSRIARLAAALAALLALALATPAAATCRIGRPGETVPVAVGSTGRMALLHQPAGPAGARLPLVLLFHGSGGSAQGIFKTSGLGATADHHRFTLLAADAGIRADDGFAWNIPGVPTVTGHVPTKDDPDDVAFVLARSTGWSRRAAPIRRASMPPATRAEGG